MQSEIVLLRHGITEGNQKHWFYGGIDISLTDEGVQQLKALRGRGVYPALPVCTQVFTTGLQRTDQTLQAVYGDLPHGTIRELQEYRFGKFEGHSFQELQNDPEFMEWVNDTTYEKHLEGGDSRGSFTRRVLTGGDILMSKHEGFCEKSAREASAKSASGPNGTAGIRKTETGLQDGLEESGEDGSLPQVLLPKDMPKKKEPPVLHGPATLAVCHGGVISQLMRSWFERPDDEIWEWVPAPGLGYVVRLEDGEPLNYEMFGAAETLDQGIMEEDK